MGLMDSKVVKGLLGNGFFKRLFDENTMSPADRARLFTWIYLCHVEAYLDHSYWLKSEDRAKCCHYWLDRNRHKAGFVYLGKLCSEAEKFARALTANADDKRNLVAARKLLSRYFNDEALTPKEASIVDARLQEAEAALRAAKLL